MDWFSKLQRIDPRIVYALMFVVLSVPLLMPLAITLEITPSTIAVYETIEELDPATDVVLLSFEYSPSAAPDIHPVAVAVVDHLTRRGIRWVGVSFWAEGPMMIKQITDDLEERGGRYGTDFANLGFKAGGENAIMIFANNPLVITTDFVGNRTAELPIMQGITHIRDFGYVIAFSAGTPGVDAWVRQVVDPLGVRMAAGVITVSVPGFVPFVQSGQLDGLLAGLRGAAEYELLLEAPGLAVSMMDAQSVGHLLIIAFILIGNATYLVTKFTKKD